MTVRLVAWIWHICLSMVTMAPDARATAAHATDVPLFASTSTLADLSSDILSRGARLRFQASGSSMHPFIREGDFITLGPLSGHHPGFGDIVAFVDHRTGRLTVHRVVGRKDGLVITKGDGVSRPDGPVPEEEILGRVESIERNNKRISLGIGSARIVIALLSRCRIRFAALAPLWAFVRPLLRLFGMTNERG